MAAAPRIVIIGAGGSVLPILTVADLLAFSNLIDAEIVLHDIDAGRLAANEVRARSLIRAPRPADPAERHD